jgi:hypothetical protein
VIEFYKQLLSERKLNPSFFLLEIIEKLYSQMPEETPFGMTELYEKLAHPKPTFSSYRNLLTTLRSAQCIKIEPSKEKASKKSVLLTEDFRIQIARDIYNEG